MSTSWNRLEVSFPMQETVCPLAFPIKIYDRFSADCIEGQQPRESTSGVVFWGEFSHA
jgi:hypothetical protein